jgi:peptidoglycan hydrolase CwlO-like protein
MEGLDIAKILAEFVLAGVIWLMSERQAKLLQEQIAQRDAQLKRLEEKLDDAHEEHRKDLRDWSGIEPRFKTWEKMAESDTKIRLTMQEIEMRNERLRNLPPGTPG